MTYTRLIGEVAGKILFWIVRGLSLSRIHPNVLTFIGLLINIYAAVLLASGKFFYAGLVIIGAGLFDMVDGRVARETQRVTINRNFYVVLTGVVMTVSIMISYTRSRSENVIPQCKVGFLERPERVVLLIIGALFDRMAAVLWVITIIGNITVIHRMMHTWDVTKQMDLDDRPGGRSH
ncbi:MAG: CDP-alcohol phosphatidyltransferase family protein [Acidobacteria bacterium]|nr:CDP-alcohol phosphatidyltransferase family protein [Acidobacteriota bacterium]